jgi:hypothetical protein
MPNFWLPGGGPAQVRVQQAYRPQTRYTSLIAGGCGAEGEVLGNGVDGGNHRTPLSPLRPMRWGGRRPDCCHIPAGRSLNLVPCLVAPRPSQMSCGPGPHAPLCPLNRWGPEEHPPCRGVARTPGIDYPPVAPRLGSPILIVSRARLPGARL